MNIAKILKDKPKDTKLYSPICGELLLNAVDSFGIFCKTDNNQHISFTDDGKYKSYGKWLNAGECLLFPSKQMRNWEKFQWKKGDILKAINGNQIIFKGWCDNDYTQFYGERNISFDNMDWYPKVSKNETLYYNKEIEN